MPVPTIILFPTPKKTIVGIFYRRLSFLFLLSSFCFTTPPPSSDLLSHPAVPFFLFRTTRRPSNVLPFPNAPIHPPLTWSEIAFRVAQPALPGIRSFCQSCPEYRRSNKNPYHASPTNVTVCFGGKEGNKGPDRAETEFPSPPKVAIPSSKVPAPVSTYRPRSFCIRVD